MCPCHQNDGSFVMAFLVTAAIVLAISVLRSRWPAMKTGSSILSVVAIALVACLGLAFGLRRNQIALTPMPCRSVIPSTIHVSDPPTSAPVAGPASRPVATAPEQQLPFKVVAYYFHRTIRCPSCLLIEEWAKQAIEMQFAIEMAAGILEWCPVNIDKPGNEHFEKDYQLSVQSLVIVGMKNGQVMQWKNLKSVWDLQSDFAHLTEYVQKEVSSFFGDASGT